MKKLIISMALATLPWAIPTIVKAQSYPEKQIKLVVPYPPGASTDSLGRMVAQKISVAMGQTVVVDNRAGASGNIGSEVVAKSAPDGYTFCWARMQHMPPICTWWQTRHLILCAISRPCRWLP